MEDSAPRPAIATLSHGLVHRFVVYRPPGTIRSFVIFLSGEEGWHRGVRDMARQLSKRGALVAGVDTPALLRSLSRNSEKYHNRCIYPPGDLSNLSHFVQAYYRLPTYLQPVLVGYSSGAGLAYASLAQAKAGTFAGVLALGLHTRWHTGMPLCQEHDLKLRSDVSGTQLLPAGPLSGPLQVLSGARDAVDPPETVAAFVRSTPEAQLTTLPWVGHGFAQPTRWLPQFFKSYERLRQLALSASLPPPPAPLQGLPLLEFPATAGSKVQDNFAILLSGDGGWSDLEQRLADALSAHGTAVVGLDSLRYFWTPRTPAGIAVDGNRIIRYYLQHWNKTGVLMLGYSQGADVLPFLINRLPNQTRLAVRLSAQLGLGDSAVFAFRLRPPPGGRDSAALATMPEMRKMDNTPDLCIYGSKESDSLCPRLDSRRIQLARLPGGHDAGGDMHKVAQVIMSAARMGFSLSSPALGSASRNDPH